MTKTAQKFKDSPSWVKHVTTAITSIVIAWVGAWQTAAAMNPSLGPRSYQTERALILATLQMHTGQLKQIDTRVNHVDVAVARSNALLQILVNGGRLGK